MSSTDVFVICVSIIIIYIHCAINSPYQFPYIVIDHHEITADMKCIVIEDSIIQLKVMYTLTQQLWFIVCIRSIYMHISSHRNDN